MLQALLELEMNSDLKAQLRELYITGAKVTFECDLCRLLQYIISGMISKA